MERWAQGADFRQGPDGDVAETASSVDARPSRVNEDYEDPDKWAGSYHLALAVLTGEDGCGGGGEATAEQATAALRFAQRVAQRRAERSAARTLP